MPELFTDIQDLRDQLDAAELDARSLVEDLAEERGCWRPDANEWSVAQCLEHLALSNRIYLSAMREPAIRARIAGRLRRGPALPGFAGRWFAAKMEPPVRASAKMKTMRKLKPETAPSLADAFASFLQSQDEIRDYLRMNADLDLAGIRFPNPFVPGIRFSVATGLHVLTAHERRHLWQAWRVRRAAEGVTREA